MNRLKMVFMIKNIANLVTNITCVLLNLSKALYIFECINLSVQDLFLSELFSGHDFSGPRLRSWSFRFCVSIFLLAFYPCIMYPRFGDLTNLAGYPPLNQISSFVITSLTTTYRWEWIIDSRKIARRCQHWRFQVSLQGKIFSVPTLFFVSLLEDEQCLSMGEEVGTVQF
jgi:hypothetical protein